MRRVISITMLVVTVFTYLVVITDSKGDANKSRNITMAITGTICLVAEIINKINF